MLISPLDWGLGHTTRCIPLIRKLTDLGHEVVVALSEPQDILIRDAFPQVEIIKIGGYQVKYPRNARYFKLKILFQLPKFFIRHVKDRLWIKKLLSKRSFDLVISDNRYAIFHHGVKSVIICHQIDIKTGSSFTDNIVNRISRKLLNRFDECWVPDYQGDENLAGELSHPKHKPIPPLLYLGPLSRFVPGEEKMRYDLAVLISGPEPQRTIFESKVLHHFQHTDRKILLVRGLPKEQNEIFVCPPNMEVHKHLDTVDLNRKLLQSKHVLCRAGYSTLMDLFVIGKTATIVPTPGQTEQEYLAEYLDGKHGFRKLDQEKMEVRLILDVTD